MTTAYGPSEDGSWVIVAQFRERENAERFQLVCPEVYLEDWSFLDDEEDWEMLVLQVEGGQTGWLDA